MGRRPRKVGRRSAPIGLLGMLALVLAIERFFDCHPLEFGLPDHGEWGRSARIARAGARDGRVLVFGDSLAKCALQPNVFERRRGLPALNLAVSACSPPGSYFLLRRALEAGARPEAIVVAFHPKHLLHRPTENAALWGQLLGARDAVDLAWNCRSASLFGRIVLHRHVPSLRSRHEIRAYFLGALMGQDTLRGVLARSQTFVFALWRNWNKNGGAFASAATPHFQGKLQLTADEEVSRRWSCQPIEHRYVRRFFALAAARGLPVYWVVPPLSPSLSERYQARGAADAFDGFARDLLAEFPNVTLLDARRSGYGLGAFVDVAHLNCRGASALSVDVAAVVAERRVVPGTGPRWIALPPFADRRQDGGLEDYNQSMLAIHNGGAGVVR